MESFLFLQHGFLFVSPAQSEALKVWHLPHNKSGCLNGRQTAPKPIVTHRSGEFLQLYASPHMQVRVQCTMSKRDTHTHTLSYAHRNLNWPRNTSVMLRRWRRNINCRNSSFLYRAKRMAACFLEKTGSLFFNKQQIFHPMGIAPNTIHTHKTTPQRQRQMLIRLCNHQPLAVSTQSTRQHAVSSM